MSATENGPKGKIPWYERVAKKLDDMESSLKAGGGGNRPRDEESKPWYERVNDKLETLGSGKHPSYAQDGKFFLRSIHYWENKNGKSGIEWVISERSVTFLEHLGKGRVREKSLPLSQISRVRLDAPAFGTCRLDLFIGRSGHADYSLQFHTSDQEVVEQAHDCIVEGISGSPRQETVQTPPVSPGDIDAGLRKLKALVDDGILTSEEFEAKKKQMLGL